MNYTILTELLYVGFSFEKGRVYTNYWKPGYKKRLKSQVEIWRKLICIIDKPNLGKEDFIVIEELKRICSAYELRYYDVYMSYIENGNFNSNLTSSFSTKQKVIIKFIIVLLEDLQKAFKKYYNKKEVFLILRTLHNLPLALICENELINTSHRFLSCEDAIDYAFSNMSEDMKVKYKQYYDN